MRPSTVIVNQTTIINNTTVINNIRHETRTIAGAGSRKVVVNEGPGVDVVQKATGKQLKAASIRELADRTTVPAEVKAKSRESKGREKSVAEPADQSKPASKQKTSPVETREPGKVAVPDVEKNRKQKKQDTFVAPPAESPKPAPEKKASPSERPERPGKPAPPDSDQKKQRSPDYAPTPGGEPRSVQPPSKPSQPDGGKVRSKGNDNNREPKDGGKKKP
jgi:hypothetical protein